MVKSKKPNNKNSTTIHWHVTPSFNPMNQCTYALLTSNFHHTENDLYSEKKKMAMLNSPGYGASSDSQFILHYMQAEALEPKRRENEEKSACKINFMTYSLMQAT